MKSLRVKYKMQEERPSFKENRVRAIIDIARNYDTM